MHSPTTCVNTRAVMEPDFQNTITMAKRIHYNDVITKYIKYIINYYLAIYRKIMLSVIFTFFFKHIFCFLETKNELGDGKRFCNHNMSIQNHTSCRQCCQGCGFPEVFWTTFMIQLHLFLFYFLFFA